jgi:hypothetical protein
MNLTDQIKSIDLVALAESQGIELRRTGTAYRGLCPLHDEKTASFYIYERKRFKCFGCGEGGDQVDLIQGIYGCNFQEALRRLGINTGTITLKERIQIKRQRIAKARRIQRERDLLYTLSFLIRTTRKITDGMTPKEFDRYGEIMDPLPAWEHYHQILSTGTREQRDEVIEGLKDMTTIRRNYLFRPGFNYRRWLFDINHNETKGVTNYQKGAATNERIRRK